VRDGVYVRKFKQSLSLSLSISLSLSLSLFIFSSPFFPLSLSLFQRSFSLCMRVEFLLKTDSGYPRDAEVTLYLSLSVFVSLSFCLCHTYYDTKRHTHLWMCVCVCVRERGLCVCEFKDALLLTDVSNLSYQDLSASSSRTQTHGAEFQRIKHTHKNTHTPTHSHTHTHVHTHTRTQT